MPLDRIVVRGAREHNLQSVDVEIPRDRLVVITGVSGSGKSSLAFDTIYAEGQRRYVESLSAYARQFLGLMEKPDVDQIDGLSPAISIDQKGASRNPRSTVGTTTEIYDHLRLLFARVGQPHCPKCGREISQQTVQQIVDGIQALPEGSRIMVMAPMVRDRKGEHQQVLEDARRAGFVRVRVDGQVLDLSEEFNLDRNRKHSIEVVVDRLVIRRGDQSESDRTRLTDSVETALKLGGGIMLVARLGDHGAAAGTGPEDILFSEHFACVHCGVSLPEIAPRLFSFNSPHGACPTCTGLGTRLEIDPDRVIPDRELAIDQGAVAAWSRSADMNSWFKSFVVGLGRKYGFTTDQPVKTMTPEQVNVLLYGTKGQPITVQHQNKYGRLREYDMSYEGIIPNLARRYKETQSDYIRQEIERYMSTKPCPDCKGARLRPEVLAVTIGGLSIVDVSRMSVSRAVGWVDSLEDASRTPLTERQRVIARQVLKELRARVGFLMDVGLDYLTLDRASASLSGGEAQRIRLATQIGSGLMGVLYICDEPSIGLHPVDDYRLIQTLKRLRDLGNTLLIVEHDEAMIRAADHIIDMGPGAGEHGGRVVVAGTLQDVMACPDSMTGAYLSGRRVIDVPSRRRRGNGKEIAVLGASENNLQTIDVRFPLGMMVCVTGVSGSGKSSLVDNILYRSLARILYKAKDEPGKSRALLGVEHVDKVVNVDQSPIGRTPRSNPATYTGLFTPIRELFATVPEARARGYLPGRFSFNVKGGRCEACKGEGFVQIEMHFLPDIEMPCEVCKGRRYNREALEILYKGKSIADVLDMTVEEALEFFQHIPQVRSRLQTLFDVGLGYMRLGQPATTLSGGEAQRVKLATELSRRATGRTLYILDEPTTGLSFSDVAALLDVLQRLVDSGNTVLLIEHNLDVIKSSDHLIDLGPGGGDYGGFLIAEGTPEQVTRVESSLTGRVLRDVLEPRQARVVA